MALLHQCQPPSVQLALGRAVGQFIKSLNLENERVLVLGTGGLSHDPPTPQMGSVPPEVEEFLIAGRNPTEEARNARQSEDYCCRSENWLRAILQLLCH